MSNPTHMDVIKNIQKKIELKKKLREVDDSKERGKIKKKITNLDSKIRSQPLPKL